MRVGLLTTSFPRFEGDGAGHFVGGFARALAARDHPLTVLAPEPSDPFPVPAQLPFELVWLAYLRPRALQRTFYGAGVPDNLRRDPRTGLGLAPFTLQLWREARRRAAHWDALVSHWALPAGLVASLLPRRPRHLAVLHSADVFALERLPAGRALARRVARGADQLLFVSRDLRRRFLALLPDREALAVAARAHVSPMGIEPGPPPPSPAARQRLRTRLGLGPGRVVLSMGRLVPIKGVDRLIAAARAEPRVNLVVAGDGSERTRLERQAQGLDNVRFTGHLHGQAKRDWLAAADAFALPSRTLPSGRSEGTPTALLEAMDAGLPVWAHPVGGVPDVLGDGQAGVWVDEGAGGWQQAFARIAHEDALRARGRHARRRARQFHWDALIPRVEALLTPDRDDCRVVAGGRRQR